MKLRLLLLAGLQLGAASAAAQRSDKPRPHEREWDFIARQIDQWTFTEDLTVIVGNATDILWTHTKGRLTPHTVVETESTSKWPMAMMLAGVAADGSFGPKGLDTLASEHLEYWTKDHSDSRWNVSLRSLLSFTSGFGADEEGSSNVSRTCMDDRNYLGGFEICAREIYATTNHSTTCECRYNGPDGSSTCPQARVQCGQVGGSFLYNSAHLQLAGAMAVKATGLSIQKLVAKYLFEAYGFNETTCDRGARNPELATCLRTTGADYSKFLSANLGLRVPSAKIVEESNVDMVDAFGGYSMYGDYAFGHFIECFDSTPGFTAACREADVHVDPGAFGFYPLQDRKRGYYMTLVAEENGKFYARSGIPEYLRLALKPLIDAKLDCDSRRSLNASSPYHRMCTPSAQKSPRLRLRALAQHTPELKSLTIADVNYCGACITDPSSCSDDDDALPVAERSPMGQLKARLTHRMRRHTVAK